MYLDYIEYNNNIASNFAEQKNIFIIPKITKISLAFFAYWSHGVIEMNPGARAKILITDGDIKQKKLAESIGISEAKLSHYLKKNLNSVYSKFKNAIMRIKCLKTMELI